MTGRQVPDDVAALEIEARLRTGRAERLVEIR
jgi:hypothetical protein